MRDSPLFELLTRQSGVLSRAQAACYFTTSAIEHRLSSGRWQSARHGIYVTHSGPIGLAERRWIAVLGAVAGQPAWLAGLSALGLYGFLGFRSPSIHVLMPASATPKRPPDGVTVHRTTRLPDSDLNPLSRPPSTRPARSLIDAAQWQQSERQAAAIILAGFQQRLVRFTDVAPVLSAMPRARHRRVIKQAIADAVGGARSLPEAEFVRLCRRGGLPAPQMQRPRRDTNGRRNYLDAYFPEQGVHVEIDGSYHVDVRQWWVDMSRQNSLWIPGERVLRFPAWAIRNRPAEVLAQLKQALTPPT